MLMWLTQNAMSQFGQKADNHVLTLVSLYLLHTQTWSWKKNSRNKSYDWSDTMPSLGPGALPNLWLKARIKFSPLSKGICKINYYLFTKLIYFFNTNNRNVLTSYIQKPLLRQYCLKLLQHLLHCFLWSKHHTLQLFYVNHPQYPLVISLLIFLRPDSWNIFLILEPKKGKK